MQSASAFVEPSVGLHSWLRAIRIYGTLLNTLLSLASLPYMVRSLSKDVGPFGDTPAMVFFCGLTMLTAAGFTFLTIFQTTSRYWRACLWLAIVSNCGLLLQALHIWEFKASLPQVLEQYQEPILIACAALLNLPLILLIRVLCGSRLRFSLRQLAFYVFLCALFLCLAGVVVDWQGLRDYKQEKTLVARLIGIDGSVTWNNRHVQHLNLERSDVSNNRLRTLDQFPQLESLNLNHSKVNDDDLLHVARATSLIQLELTFTPISHQGLAHLASLTNLQILRLPSTPLTDEGLKTVAQLGELRELNIESTKVTDDGLKLIATLPHLSDLKLKGTDTTDEGIASLAACSNLRVLHLHHLPITDAGLAHLAGLAEMTDLILLATKITDAGLVHLQAMTNLESLNLVFTNITDEGLRALANLPNLRQIDLSYTKVTPAGVAWLKQKLPRCTIERRERG
jgi:hypothetical protein